MARELTYRETPIQKLSNDILNKHDITLLIKREDQNHPFISGNKWWKLKYNLAEVTKKNHTTILTFGGAFSNHIYSTAAAANELGLKSIGVIRGEETPLLNPTLAFAKAKGMHLHYVSREEYRKKKEEAFIDHLYSLYGSFYLIPEGGTNDFALTGTEELGKKILQEDFDYIILPVGTGGTIAGIINAFNNKKEIIGVSVLKNGAFLNDDINHLLSNKYSNWTLLLEYHHGGYAKSSQELNHFIQEIMTNDNVPLDHVYTGKMLWAVMEEVKKGFFRKGSTILALHTGGLQGAITQTSL